MKTKHPQGSQNMYDDIYIIQTYTKDKYENNINKNDNTQHPYNRTCKRRKYTHNRHRKDINTTDKKDNIHIIMDTHKIIDTTSTQWTRKS